jgi:hypothetical protein
MYDQMTSDPHETYTLRQIVALIELAEKRGYPLEPGSYLESLTVKQLARLMNDHFDA